jgi:hypothetical protein
MIVMMMIMVMMMLPMIQHTIRLVYGLSGLTGHNTFALPFHDISGFLKHLIYGHFSLIVSFHLIFFLFFIISLNLWKVYNTSDEENEKDIFFLPEKSLWKLNQINVKLDWLLNCTVLN